MSDRRNFTKAVRVAIVKRATRPILIGAISEQYCEKCGQPCKGRFHIHHLREDGLDVEKSKPLTAADGALWCIPCHDEHTRKFSIPAIAKAKRREAEHLGAGREKQPIKSDPDALKSRERPKHEGREPVPGQPGILRRFVTLGDAASAVLAKITPRKDAAE